MNRLPDDWDDVSIADFGEIFGGGTPSRSNPYFWNGTIPWVTPSEITSLRGKFVSSTKENITKEGLAGSAARLLPPGSVLVTTRATLGETAISQVPLATNQGFKNIIPNDDTDALYAYYRLRELRREMLRLASGTTFLEISKTDFARVRTHRPKRTEQVRIASALNTLDETIANTELAIVKLAQVRIGLIHDLLTRGIDENGHLRNPVADPSAFQGSPLGRVPRDWGVIRIDDEVDIEHGFAFDGSLFADKPLGPRLLVPGNFHREGGLYFTSENTKYFAGQFPSDTILANGDILIVMTDLSPMTLILGRTVLLNESFPLLHNQRIGKFRFKRSADWNPAFFVALMNDEMIRRKVIRESTGTTVRHTSPDRIKSGFALKPEPTEQDKIVHIIAAADSALQVTRLRLKKLEVLKSGLVTDLLTGCVRVPEWLELPSLGGTTTT